MLLPPDAATGSGLAVLVSAGIAILLPLSLIEFTSCSIQTRQLPFYDCITIARLRSACQGNRSLHISQKCPPLKSRQGL